MSRNKVVCAKLMLVFGLERFPNLKLCFGRFLVVIWQFGWVGWVGALLSSSNGIPGVVELVLQWRQQKEPQDWGLHLMITYSPHLRIAIQASHTSVLQTYHTWGLQTTLKTVQFCWQACKAQISTQWHSIGNSNVDSIGNSDKKFRHSFHGELWLCQEAQAIFG